MASSLFLMPFFGINKEAKSQNLNFSIGSGIEIPTNEVLREYAGPLAGINASIRGNISENMFIGGGAELHVGEKGQEDITVNTANIGIHGLYGWNLEGFSIGFGPAAYFGNYLIKEKGYSERLKRNMWFPENESLTGIGGMFKMAYEFPVSDKGKMGVYGKYSYCDEGDANLGTFGIGLSYIFSKN